MSEFDRKWERIQQQLGAQLRGDEPHLASSGRTMFGIKSSVELKMEEVAREMEERAREQRLAQKREQKALSGDDRDRIDAALEMDATAQGMPPEADDR